MTSHPHWCDTTDCIDDPNEPGTYLHTKPLAALAFDEGDITINITQQETSTDGLDAPRIDFHGSTLFLSADELGALIDALQTARNRLAAPGADPEAKTPLRASSNG